MFMSSHLIEDIFIESEVFAVNVSTDHVSDSLASPLWSHVTNTLDSDEFEAVKLLNITRNLTVGVPWPVFLSFNDGPVERLDPALGTISSDGTISVTRVEHKFGLISENLIDPLGSFVLNVVSQSR